MTSDSEFVAFVNHAIQLALDLMAYPTIWAVLLILLETQDVNTLLQGIFGVYHYFYFWWENLMSHVTYDVEGTQDAILDPL